MTRGLPDPLLDGVGVVGVPVGVPVPLGGLVGVSVLVGVSLGDGECVYVFVGDGECVYVGWPAEPPFPEE